MQKVIIAIFLSVNLYANSLFLKEIEQHFNNNITDVKDFCIKNRDIFKNKKSESNKYHIFIKNKFKDGSFIASFESKNINYRGYFSKDGKLINGGIVKNGDAIGKWCHFKNDKLTWVNYSQKYPYYYKKIKEKIFKLLKNDNVEFTLTKDITTDKKVWKVDIGIYCLTLYFSGINGELIDIDYISKIDKNIFLDCIKNKKYTIKECLAKLVPQNMSSLICPGDYSFCEIIIPNKIDKRYGECSKPIKK